MCNIQVPALWVWPKLVHIYYLIGYHYSCGYALLTKYYNYYTLKSPSYKIKVKVSGAIAIVVGLLGLLWVWFFSGSLLVAHLWFPILWSVQLVVTCMVLHIIDNHILYYCMVVFRLTILGCNYLVVQGLVRGMILSPTNILTGDPNIYWYITFFHGMFGYFHTGFHAVPCHQFVPVLDITNHFVVT